MERYLPKDVVYRSKTGFGAPVRNWVVVELDGMINDLLSKNKLHDRGIFAPEEIEKLVKNNKLGLEDSSYVIFCLLAIESWYTQFVCPSD